MSSIEKITTFARLECGWPRTDRWNQHTDARHTRPWLLDLLFRNHLISLFSLFLLLPLSFLLPFSSISPKNPLRKCLPPFGIDSPSKRQFNYGNLLTT